MTATTTTKGEQTRAAILEAGRSLFSTQGYNATSMRMIAQEAGIALGGIYNHFSGKEEIFAAVFLAHHPFLEMLPAIEAAEGETIEAFIRNAAQQMLAAMTRQPDFLNLMFIEIVEFKSKHAREVFAGTLPRGLAIFDKFQSKRGKLRAIPAPMLIRTFVGLFFSYYMAEAIFGEAAPPDFRQDAMTHYVDIYLHGVMDTGSS